ncbi:hypothetical protein [Actinoplanes sp. L3-i22]|uniref:hypothetical protein n=1 Tax=Actinoplanes sp. L3-i22 TaxID=2836373 RepID=UPI001C7810CF|nr:hypothetical protein [Actinoplanes sp. L3-i22]BCY12560.1 hypothetical protein L3i22_076480 [Actinoplanes sp. L3-i22]
MRHLTALLWATLAGAALGAGGLTAPADADVPGFSVRLTTPATFQAGGTTKTITAVASSDQTRCRKVRWTLVVTGGKVPLNQIRVTRVENNREFATQVSTSGNTATIIDDQVDPGTLCRGRTVTGQWLVGFTGRDGGEVRFEAQADDAQNTRLTSISSTTEVTTKVATASPAPTPTKTTKAPTASASPTEDDPIEEVTEPTQPANRTTSASALVPASTDQSNLLGPGLIVGGVFFFLGLILLLRLRSRTKEARRQSQTLPTGFYTMP